MRIGYLGVDVGSVSTNLAIVDEAGNFIMGEYLRTDGKPIAAVQQGLYQLGLKAGKDFHIAGVGSTGSGRYLISIAVGADIVKNEITAHAVAATHINPEVRTIIEIGGQDSKIILLRQGIVSDFAMNTICAAGTGSFLDQQANRLRIPIEEFGDLALDASNPVRIAGRCAVFAESDMVHKQQLGYNLEDIIAGLCDALVRNYINNLAKGKEILGPIMFQGGVAANKGLVRSFEKVLQTRLIIPPQYGLMGALGAAILAKESSHIRAQSRFKGFDIQSIRFKTTSFECEACSNACEVVQFFEDKILMARWGDRCGRWEMSP